MSADSRRVWGRVLAIVLLTVGVSVVARSVLGPRGELVPSLLLGAYPTLVAGFIAVRWLRGAGDRRLSPRNRTIVTALAVLPAGFAVFFGWQSALVALDLLSPFDTIDTEVVGTRYAAGGRGPGVDHLYTAGGAVYSYPVFTFAKSDLVGLHTITLSRYQHLVIEVR